MWPIDLSDAPAWVVCVVALSGAVWILAKSISVAGPELRQWRRPAVPQLEEPHTEMRGSETRELQ